MKKWINVYRKMTPVLLGMLLAMVGSETAIAKHKPNHNPNDASFAAIEAEFSDGCLSVYAESDKDLSNVVLLFVGGTWEKFDDLDGPSGTFAGTGTNDGLAIESAYIKSGSFLAPIGVTDPDSRKTKMIKFSKTFTCADGPILS